MNSVTIGLFGTCGLSTWRNKFVDAYTKNGINFFNPQLPEGVWTADRADEFVQQENYNLKNNQIILFPVTNETTGQGSLAEIGFSVLDTIRNLNQRYLIVLIDLDCKCSKSSALQIEESKRSRKLVKSKIEIESKSNPYIFLVNNFDDMLNLSIELKNSIEFNNELKKRYC